MKKKEFLKEVKEKKGDDFYEFVKNDEYIDDLDDDDEVDSLCMELKTKIIYREIKEK